MTKYGNERVQFNGHWFDSIAERDYYKKLLRMKNEGMVAEIILQPSFLLQEGFKKNGANYKPIKYIADFKVIYSTGYIEIIDVKGVETEVFKIKHKLFEKLYPEYHLTIIKEGVAVDAKAKPNKKTKTKGAKTKKVIKKATGNKTYGTRR